MNMRQAKGMVSFKEAFEKALDRKMRGVKINSLELDMVISTGTRTVDFCIVDKY